MHNTRYRGYEMRRVGRYWGAYKDDSLRFTAITLSELETTIDLAVVRLWEHSKDGEKR